MLTQERLKEVLSYDAQSGVFVWRITRHGKAKAGRVAGAINPRKYRMIYIDGVNYRAHRLAFLYMTGAFPLNEVDHVNGCHADNRWDNLRDVTRVENIHNQFSCSGESGLRGVTRSRRKFRACITTHGKRIRLGTFDTAIEAHLAYLDAKAKYHLLPP